jgi:hypothetical protein
MEKTNIITESVDLAQAGDNVEIYVEDVTEFVEGEWVLIETMQGYVEAAKITDIDTGADMITVNKLINDCTEGSVLTQLKTDELLNQFILYESAVATGINAIGGSYTFATGYTFPEYSVQKGVPYPHFQKAVDENIKLRDVLKNKIWAKLNPLS